MMKDVTESPKKIKKPIASTKKADNLSPPLRNTRYTALVDKLIVVVTTTCSLRSRVSMARLRFFVSSVTFECGL